MSAQDLTALSHFPDHYPDNLFEIPVCSAPEAMQHDVKALYDHFLTQGQAIASGEVVIDPKHTITVVDGRHVEVQSRVPALGNMHPSFAITLPDSLSKAGDANKLTVDINELDDLNQPNVPGSTQVKSYHYTLSADGEGEVQLTSRPFEQSFGILYYSNVFTTEKGLLTAKDLAKLDELFGTIAINQVPKSKVDERVQSPSSRHRNIGQRLRRLKIFGPFTDD